MSKIPRIFEVFEKRREYPRLQMDLPLKIVCSNGIEADARFFDLSPDGAQVRYSRDAADRLFGLDMTTPRGFKPVTYKLSTRLIDGDFAEQIIIGFLPVYQLPIDNDTWSMGLLFNRGDKEMLGKINRFLLYELQPDQPGSDPVGQADVSTRDRLNHILHAGLREAGDTPPPAATVEHVRPAAEDTDLVRQELLRISTTLGVLLEAVNDIKRRLGYLEQKP